MTAELPLPVCPVGAVTGLGTEAASAEPPRPGTSPLDDGLRDLHNLAEELRDAQDVDKQGGQA